MKKLTIIECQEYATNNGGICLTGDYINNKIKMMWQCKDGHIWRAGFGSIRSGTWCKKCAHIKLTISKTLSIKDCIDFANTKNGKCLSDSYINGKSLMVWQCINKHIWNASFTNVKNNNTWCPKCNNDNKKLSINECHNIATQKNGKCLSNIYIDNKSLMLWECQFGHQWKTSFANIKNQNQWCLKCSGSERLVIDECITLAIKRGGKCLSNEYINSSSNMSWQCGDGHVWQATFNSIKSQKSWCLICSGLTKLTLKECKDLAIFRGGECLSEIYQNVETKMSWKCKNNHIWNATFHKIKSGQWCPECISNISKPQKDIYEYIISIMPGTDILLNDTKTIKPLHLDIYIPSLKIAIEYDGWRWHYSEWAIKTGAFERTLKKNIICKEQNINLLRINEKDWQNNKEAELQKIIDFIG